MSSAAPHGGATASSSSAADASSSSAALTVDVTRNYFCHQCCLAGAIAGGAACPICHGDFLEEIDLPLSQNPSTFLPIGSLSLSPAAFFLRSPADTAALFHSDISPLHSKFSFPTATEDRINKVIHIGVRVHAIIVGVPPAPPDNFSRFIRPPNHPSGPPTGMNLCRFADEIFDNELEEGSNVFGKAAARSAIAALPDMEMAGGEALCSVCQETYAAGDGATQLPCNHVFHRDCILQWLVLRNSCPECRFNLLTEDQEEGIIGITAVYVIVMLPVCYHDPPRRVATVERRMAGRFIPRQ